MPSTPPPCQGLDHVELLVPDRDEAAAWYARTLGCEPLAEYADWADDPEGPLMVSPDGGATKIAFFQGDDGDLDDAPADGGIRRIALRYGGRAFIALRAHLAACRVRGDDDARIGDEHIVDHGRAFSIYFRDPWGHPLEATTYDEAIVRAWLGGLAVSTDEPEAEPSRADERRPARPAPPAHEFPAPIMLEGVHPAMLDDDALLKQCTVTFGRTGGPGGQHRNRVETAVDLRHDPSGVEAWASERRKQIENRHMALRRLRMKLALRVRTNVHHEKHRPSALWCSRRQGTQLSINPQHRDYPALLAEALDVIFARRFDCAGAAGLLGVTMSQLSRLMRHERHALAWVNDGRARQGLPLLR